MNLWLVLGLFLLGAAVGALLTAIFYTGQIRRIEVAMLSSQHERTVWDDSRSSSWSNLAPKYPRAMELPMPNPAGAGHVVRCHREVFRAISRRDPEAAYGAHAEAYRSRADPPRSAGHAQVPASTLATIALRSLDSDLRPETTCAAQIFHQDPNCKRISSALRSSIFPHYLITDRRQPSIGRSHWFRASGRDAPGRVRKPSSSPKPSFSAHPKGMLRPARRAMTGWKMWLPVNTSQAEHDVTG
jgi:hypothetical protein